MTVAHRQCSWALGLLGALAAEGARRFVIAPGSRHTPLVLAAHNLAAAGHVEIHDVLDERVAGFVALGAGRVTGCPTVVLTTSGSAGAHLLPAVIEADRSRVPMIVVTADRPDRLQGVGAPQTIRQHGLFGCHARAAEIAAPLSDSEPPGELAARVFRLARGPEPGSVHLNVPFEKPLWEPGADPLPEASDLKLTSTEAPVAALTPDALERLADALEGAQRGLLFLGPGDPGHARGRYERRRDELAQAALGLAEILGWPVVTDGASPARLGRATDPMITSMESLVRSGWVDDAQPDLIVRTGQVATSTGVQRWFATRSCRSIALDPSGRRQDPAGVSDEPLVAEPAEALLALAGCLKGRGAERAPSAWSTAWLAGERRARRTIEACAREAGSWSGAVVRATLQQLPEGGLLHVASSMPIRDLDAFSGVTNRRLYVAANRGANGIDGLVATSLGEALAWGGPVVSLLGDLALSHDLGGLAAAQEALRSRPSASLTLVVLDNGGGAIFDELPIAEHPTAHEPRFVTPKGLDIGEVGAALGVVTKTVEASYAEVSDALGPLLETPGLSLVHVKVDREGDASARRATHERVAVALESTQRPGEVSV